MHVYIHTCVYICTYTYAYAGQDVHTEAPKKTICMTPLGHGVSYIRACMCAHAHMHIYTHMYLHMYIYIFNTGQDVHADAPDEITYDPLGHGVHDTDPSDPAV